jgi:hypothetical protein
MDDLCLLGQAAGGAQAEVEALGGGAGAVEPLAVVGLASEGGAEGELGVVGVGGDSLEVGEGSAVE